MVGASKPEGDVAAKGCGQLGQLEMELASHPQPLNDHRLRLEISNSNRHINNVAPKLNCGNLVLLYLKKKGIGRSTRRSKAGHWSRACDEESGSKADAVGLGKKTILYSFCKHRNVFRA
jgi:hypothetical protein